MRYGENTPEAWSKFDYAATAAASLAYLLQQQQDSVGLVTFNNEVQLNLPPAASSSHLRRILHELENTEPDDQTDVDDVFALLAHQLNRRGLVVLVSDLLLPVEKLTKALQQFRVRGHEVVVFHVMHDHELTFPFDQNTLFRGLETDAEIHTEPRALRKSYLEVVERFLEEVRRACAMTGVDHVLMSTQDPLDAALASYLTFRQRSRRSAVRR